jgi:hypothetical protein
VELPLYESGRKKAAAAGKLKRWNCLYTKAQQEKSDRITYFFTLTTAAAPLLPLKIH